MWELKEVEVRVRQRLKDFLENSDGSDEASDGGGIEIQPNTDLIRDAGFTSLQGLEFVLDLCEEFDSDFPADFNPFVDDERRRGQTFDGLVKAVQRQLPSEGAPDDKK